MRCVARLAAVCALLLAGAAFLVHRAVFDADDPGSGRDDGLLEKGVHRSGESLDEDQVSPQSSRIAQGLVKKVVSGNIQLELIQRMYGLRRPDIEENSQDRPKLLALPHLEWHEHEVTDKDNQASLADQSASDENTGDELHRLYQELHSNPLAVTKEVMLAQKITFIRIPLCESQSLINPMATVAKRNVPSLTLTMVPNITTRGEGNAFNEKLIFEYLYRYPMPYLSVGGHCFVNFRRYGDFQPISFTVFADPVERFISMFYLVRKVSTRRGENGSSAVRLGPEAAKATLEKCATLLDKSRGVPGLSQAVQRKYCGFELSTLARVMCGEDKRCSPHDSTNYTLLSALGNLDDFLVVGFTDELETTATAMERLLPFYLKGCRQEFLNQFQNKTAKETYSPGVTKKLRRVMRTDYLLYNTARARFEKLKKELGL